MRTMLLRADARHGSRFAPSVSQVFGCGPFGLFRSCLPSAAVEAEIRTAGLYCCREVRDRPVDVFHVALERGEELVDVVVADDVAEAIARRLDEGETIEQVCSLEEVAVGDEVLLAVRLNPAA